MVEGLVMMVTKMSNVHTIKFGESRVTFFSFGVPNMPKIQTMFFFNKNVMEMHEN